MTLRIGELCAGYGGLGTAVTEVLGGDVAWVADNDPGASAILARRFPSVPNYGDITVTDWGAVEPVDVMCAGFPCQDVSCAGARAGLREGNRTGVWAHVARAIDELRPALVVLENVRGLLTFGADSGVEPCPWCMGDAGDESVLRACGAVLADLADLGFDAEWLLVPAAEVGAPHRRERVFILAWPAADPDRATGGQWRLAAPGEAEGGRPRADAGGRGGAPATDADLERLRTDGRAAHGDAGVDRTDDAEPAGGRGATAAEWGAYEPAIRRWERVLGRPAPAPTEPGRTGQRLSPAFVEFLMGLPEGWVTDVPGLSRNAQLKALGNGVVPAQAAMALRLLLDRADIPSLVAAKGAA